MKVLSCATLVFLTLCYISACTSPTAELNTKKSNVLLILVDDLGWSDVAVYNPETNYSTPNMDKLAKQGLVFTNGYAASPICSPTRASLITGVHPTKMGTTDFFRNTDRNKRYREGKFKPAKFKQELPEKVVTIASVLNDDGYDTAFLGKWHLGQTEDKWPEYYGFDVNVGGHVSGSPQGGYFAPYKNPRLKSGPKGEYLTDRLTSEALTLLDGFSKTDAPFFMMMSFYSVHTPLGAPKELVDKYKNEFKDKTPNSEFAEIEQIWPTKKPRRNRISQTHATYAGMVERVDENIGRLVDELEAKNLREDTIVILLSDNGGLSTSEGLPTSNLPLNGGKGWLYEGGIRVPFIISVPGSDTKGKQSATPVVSMDIAATLYDMIGIDEDKIPEIDGQSLKPLLTGTNELEQRPLFFHYPHYSNQGGFPGAAIRLGDWKLLERFEDGKVNLFDLSKDIGEKQDLAAQYPKKVEELRNMLHDWYKESDAKFLNSNSKRPQYGQPWTPAE